MRRALYYCALIVLAGCARTPEPPPLGEDPETARVVVCPARAPEPTCGELPVDVTDEVAVGEWAREPTTPAGRSERAIDALVGWQQCRSEVEPYRAGRARCEQEGGK